MKLVIVGAGGRLGTALAREYREKFSVIGFDHAQLDLANADELREKLCTIDFDLLINAAAFANVDLCEKEREAHSFQHRLRIRWRKARTLYRKRSGKSDQRVRRIEKGRGEIRLTNTRSTSGRAGLVGFWS